MTARIAGIVVATLLLVATAGSTHALCICGDTDGCGSALSCSGKNPGDACTPPKNATCKVVKGNAEGLSCCCGCSRGAVPLSCVYGDTASRLAALEGATCGAPKLDKLTTHAVGRARKLLASGEKACAKGKTGGVPGRLRAARNALAGVEKKLDKLVAKGVIDSTCAGSYRALADTFIAEIDSLASGGTGGGGGTTTTTTIPGGGTCSGTLTAYDANEFDMSFACPGGSGFTGFTVMVPGGRHITDFLRPNGFTCAVLGAATWDCTGDFGGDTVYAGRLHVVPAPSSGMGATFTVGHGGATYGPFPMTGP